MSMNPKTVEGIYRDGKVELLESPENVAEARVIVTFLDEGTVNLSDRGIDEAEAANLRARLMPFVEDWESPEMEAYDAL
ncbi:MAG: hypothetical protein QOF62_1473 [Pyrinomonadaceae bacterium]|nr:hypothetical protein [Pyrinomonadaceae bacterium]